MAGRIPNTFIDQLLGRVDIVEVIDGRVPLTKKGREYVARCPFHDEKTPSFTVSPTKQFFHCFGCGVSGSALGFLMQYAHLGFVEAVEQLADQVGLTIPDTALDGRNGRRRRVNTADTNDLRDLLVQANRWFQQQLREHPEAKVATDYLKQRGLDGKTAAAFGLGYAPTGWRGLCDALGCDVATRTRLYKIGLLSQKSTTSPTAQYYDRFRARIIFPIMDARERVVGFGGRAIGDDQPKYLNSPETSFFHKSNELYGLPQGRRAIGQEEKCLVVEGYMDVISLAQAGIGNVVATLGTATTRTHIQRLFQIADEIVFCFDRDRAGQQAAYKAMVMALPEMRDGRQSSFLLLPVGEDPDSSVRQEGAAGFRQRIAQATPFAEFFFNRLGELVDLRREDGRARLVELARPLLATLPKGALREKLSYELLNRSGLRTTAELNIANGATAAPNASFSASSKEHNRRNASHISAAPPLSLIAQAVNLLLQQPLVATTWQAPPTPARLELRGAAILLKMLEFCRASPLTTASLLEKFRTDANFDYLQRLAVHNNYIDEAQIAAVFTDTMTRLYEVQNRQQRTTYLTTAAQRELTNGEKTALTDSFAASQAVSQRA